MQNAHWLSVTLFSIGDAVIATDPETRITFMNPVAESLTGWTMDEASGLPLENVFQIINQETRNTVESPVDKALREGVIVGLANHTLLIAKDGTERPIDDSAAPIRDEQGSIAGVVLVFRDITERYRQEQTIRETLAYAENIIATLREPFLVLDNHLRVQSANRTFYETFQVTPGDTEGCLVYDLGNGQWDSSDLRRMLNEVLADHHPINDYEVEHDFPKIGKRQMLLNACHIRKPGNHSNLILLAMEDITARKQAAHDLMVSEIRYRRLFESARDGILILDVDSMEIIDSNPYMHQLVGCSADQFLGKKLWEIGSFKDKSKSEEAMRTLKETGYVRYEDLPLESESGDIMDVEFICNEYEEDGHDVYQCNIRDISARKQMELAVQERIRTQAQANVLAETGRRKDEFLAMLSHELRNPMAPIFNALQLMSQEGENELQRETRGVIERQVRHLSKLTDDLLEVSRISTGRIRMHLERVDLNGIIRAAVERIKPTIERNEQQLSVELAEGVVWLSADATRLEQVFGNLLNNASKYNQQGGHIWLNVTVEDDRAVVHVRDDGVGMSAELLPEIFELFTQADKSLDRSDGGLGIGLALVKSLVELHRGSVEAHSAGVGQGSEFVVRLPVSKNGDDVADANGSVDSISPQESKSLRVLVVDDNVDAARMCALLLRSWGHEARISHDGPDALNRASGFLPQVILCDIGLPEMDGYEVARHLRQNPQLQDILLVAITGYGSDSDKQRAEEAGFDMHLVKPVESNDLKKLLTDFQAKNEELSL